MNEQYLTDDQEHDVNYMVTYLHMTYGSDANITSHHGYADDGSKTFLIRSKDNEIIAMVKEFRNINGLMNTRLLIKESVLDDLMEDAPKRSTTLYLMSLTEYVNHFYPEDIMEIVVFSEDLTEMPPLSFTKRDAELVIESVPNPDASELPDESEFFNFFEGVMAIKEYLAFKYDDDFEVITYTESKSEDEAPVEVTQILTEEYEIPLVMFYATPDADEPQEEWVEMVVNHDLYEQLTEKFPKYIPAQINTALDEWLEEEYPKGSDGMSTFKGDPQVNE